MSSISSSSWFKMPVYSSSIIEKTLEDGDKLILHNSILESLLYSSSSIMDKLPNPLIFLVENCLTGEKVHCGVLEFSAPQVLACMPDWMMENLNIQPGQDIRIRLTELPRLSHLHLQPVQYNFLALPAPKPALEFALRKFTALTMNQKIRIQIGLFHYDLWVRDFHPKTVSSPPGVCLINTQLTVEFDPPIEKGPEEEKVEILAHDQTVEKPLGADKYHYYRYKAENPDLAVKFLVTAVPSDSPQRPDLYLSTKVDRPTPVNAMLTAGRTGELIVQPGDSSFTRSWFYLAVHSYRLPGNYKIAAQEITPTATPTNSAASPAKPVDPAAKECSNCHQFISPNSYSLHSAQCARLNWWCGDCRKLYKKAEKDFHAHCPDCAVVLHKDDIPKHMDLLHSTAFCELCGAECPVAGLEDHKAKACEYRMITCQYCEMQLPAQQLAVHKADCGSKSIPCARCSALVPRKRMDIHLATEHNVNPSLTFNSRSNMGARIGAPEAINRAKAQIGSALHGFQSDPEKAKAADLAALSTDEALARALQESEADVQSMDYALEQAILESQRDATRSQEQNAPPSNASATVQDWDDEGDAGDEELGDDWGASSPKDSAAQPSSRGGSDPQCCPYCSMTLIDYEKLIQHMNECEAIDED